MEKIIKRTGAMLLALCLTISCFSFKSHAAEGTLQFSDPSAAAGDKFTVRAKVTTGGAKIGDVDVTVTYDPSILKFESGTNAAGGDGTVKLSSKGDGSTDTATFTMDFTALKEGTTKLQATDATAYLFSNETLNLTKGDSTVTIQGGTPVSDTGDDKDKQDSKASTGGHTVKVDGKTYTINENFSEAAIPKGFEAKDTELDGKKTKAMYQKASDQYMYYLEDSDGKSDYYLYSADDGSFTQTAVVDVNSDLSIYLMNHKDKEGLPSVYKETALEIGGKKFTAWNNTSDKNYYLVYALSSDGNKGYYQYDSTEKTYQRYLLPAVVNNNNTTGSFTDKVMNLLQKHMILIMCVVWGAFLLLVILLIVLGVKLSHRNQELDDLYDEYGIGDDDDDNDDNAPPRIKKQSREQFIDTIGDEEDFDEDYDEDYEDDEDAIYDDDDEFDDYDGDYDEDYDGDCDEDYYDDDYDEEQSDEPYEDTSYRDNKKTLRRSKKSNNKDDDDFSMDFIDL